MRGLEGLDVAHDVWVVELLQNEKLRLQQRIATRVGARSGRACDEPRPNWLHWDTTAPSCRSRGVVGGVLAGYVSDRFNARSLTSAGFVYLSIPVLYAYREYGSSSMAANVVLMMLAGMLVNGPYALITTAVSADLGTHESLKGNARALATVTAIIDGTGSIGAAIGPMLTGWISSHTDDWNNVFFMLYAADLIAGLLLMKLVMKEIRTMPVA